MWRNAGFLVLTSIMLLLFNSAPVVCAESPEDPWATADARIEKYRKGDLVVRVVDETGRPIPKASVHVQQTRHHFLFGSNIFQWGRIEDPSREEAYRQRFADLLNYATVGFYWASYERRQGQPDHEYAQAVAEWCREHGIAVKGHPLAWNSADPSWLPDDPDEILRLQFARIEDCVSRFRGLIDRWDVVNEVTEYDRAEFAQRRAPKLSAAWRKAGQIEFAQQCFQHARKANPNATLLIKDSVTSSKYERVIEQLVDANGSRLYDVIGIQSHMHGGTWSNERIWEVCERFARFNVPLHFTEMTILSGAPGWERPRPWKTTPEGEEIQAREVVRVYTMLFSHPAVEAITWWDFSDYRSWQGAPAGFIRSDMSPKPAYTELYKLLKQKWWTDQKLSTNDEGRVQVRAFLGDYRVTVEADGRSPTTQELKLEPGRPAEIKIVLRPKG